MVRYAIRFITVYKKQEKSKMNKYKIWYIASNGERKTYIREASDKTQAIELTLIYLNIPLSKIIKIRRK